VRTRHLIGRANGEGRVSSALVQLDVVAMMSTTRSGRRYQLTGPTGRDPDALYVFRQLCCLRRITGTLDLSRSLMRLRYLHLKAMVQVPSDAQDKEGVLAVDAPARSRSRVDDVFLRFG
jgi:hypothetical protein